MVLTANLTQFFFSYIRRFSVIILNLFNFDLDYNLSNKNIFRQKKKNKSKFNK